MPTKQLEGKIRLGQEEFRLAISMSGAPNDATAEPGMAPGTLNVAELQRWVWLRAIEWSSWPAFLSQPLIPLLVIFFPLWWIALALVAADLLWRPIQFSLVSARLAAAGMWFVVLLKWPSVLAALIYLAVQKRYAMMGFVLIWPFLAGFVAVPGSLICRAMGIPANVGRIELEFAKQVGLVPEIESEGSPDV